MSAIMFRECHIDNVIFFVVIHVNSLPNLKMMLVSCKLINSFEIGHFVPYLEKKIEWVRDCCLTLTHHCSSISWWEQDSFRWDDGEVCFVLDQHAQLNFYSSSSLKQQSADRHVAPLKHIILIPSQPVFGLSP